MLAYLFQEESDLVPAWLSSLGISGAPGTTAGKSRSALAFADLLELLNAKRDELDRAVAAALERHPDLDLLTERELEVLRLLATGKSNAELATQLFLGEGTIKTHVSHVLSKLGLRDRVQAVVYAFESGLVQPGQAP